MADIAALVADYWNGDGGRRWVDGIAHFERVLLPMGAVVVDAASPRPGEQVVEVGCGTGQMALRLAAAVAPTGHVVAIDIAAQMLEVARDRAVEAGIDNVTFVQADAARVDLPAGGFDLLVSRFGVMFFAEPAAAFAHLAGLLRPGGRLAFVCWQEAARCEYFTVPAAIAARHAPEAMAELAASPLPGPFTLADPSLVRSLLAGAGLEDIEITSVEMGLPVGADVDEAIEAYRQGPALQALLRSAPDAFAAVEADLRRRLVDHSGPDGVVMGGAAWLVTARRP